MTVLDTLLTDIPPGWSAGDVYVGKNWILALVTNGRGDVRAGVANAQVATMPPGRFEAGHTVLHEAAERVAGLLLSCDRTEAAVALATLNALNLPAESKLTTDDAADWLAANCAGRSLAIFGRFPFIEAELRPQARQVWVFEQQPRAGEFDQSAIPSLLPQADIVAITGSSVINHTIDTILPYVEPRTRVVLLGPSTPLCERLFAAGIDAMFGVCVTDVQAVVESVLAGAGFQTMRGLRRVALIN